MNSAYVSQKDAAESDPWSHMPPVESAGAGPPGGEAGAQPGQTRGHERSRPQPEQGRGLGWSWRVGPRALRYFFSNSKVAARSSFASGLPLASIFFTQSFQIGSPATLLQRASSSGGRT